MRTFTLFLALAASANLFGAEPPTPPVEADLLAPPVADVRIETPVEMEQAIAPEDLWSQGAHGVLPQFLQAPTVFTPVNPLAKPEAGFGESNLSFDPVTGRVMGLRLIKFEF